MLLRKRQTTQLLSDRKDGRPLLSNMQQSTCMSKRRKKERIHARHARWLWSFMQTKTMYKIWNPVHYSLFKNNLIHKDHMKAVVSIHNLQVNKLNISTKWKRFRFHFQMKNKIQTWMPFPIVRLQVICNVEFIWNCYLPMYTYHSSSSDRTVLLHFDR